MAFSTKLAASIIRNGYFEFRGDQQYTSMPRVIRTFTPTNSSDIVMRVKTPMMNTTSMANTTNTETAMYVMYISTSDSALYLDSPSQLGVVTLAWNTSGYVHYYGVDSEGAVFEQTANCGPVIEKEVQWTVTNRWEDMSVTIGNCLAMQAKFSSCKYLDRYWDKSSWRCYTYDDKTSNKTIDDSGDSVHPTSTPSMSPTPVPTANSSKLGPVIGNFYLYSGVQVSN